MAPVRDRLRALAGIQLAGPIDCAQELVRIATAGHLRGRKLRIGQQSLRGALRRPPGHGPVEGGAESVDIGPGALLANVLMLFQRRVERRVGGEDRPFTTPGDVAGGTKVDQHRRSVAANEDVCGLDVAMDDAGRMDAFQPIEQRFEDGA